MESRLTKHAYLCGEEKSIADLSAACELDQGQWVDLDLSAYPKVDAWKKHMIDNDAKNN